MGDSKTREEEALGTRWLWRNDFKSISLLPPGFLGALLWAGAPQPVSDARTGQNWGTSEQLGQLRLRKREGGAGEMVLPMGCFYTL